MTGIERLREFVAGISPITVVCGVTKTSYDREHMEVAMSRLRDFLSDIADQIDREQDASVADSPYDAILPEDREALRWVRERGGLETVEARLMPEGYEWPTVDGKPVDFVTGYEPSLGALEAVSIYSNGACEVMGHDGIIKDVREIHVATPKVLDADGVEIEVGDTVYVLGFGEPLTVKGFTDDGRVLMSFHDENSLGYKPSKLTHEQPDSWERIEDDATLPPRAYYARYVGRDVGLKDDEEVNGAFGKSLVRRCKALAERS